MAKNKNQNRQTTGKTVTSTTKVVNKKERFINVNHNIVLPILYAVLFAAFAFYMLAIRNADYLYAAQEHSLFLYDKSFFDMMMVKPGSLMAYLGCFGTQFFHEPSIGVSILIAVWLITYFLAIKAFKLNGWWSVLALLPIGALLCSETIIGYWLYYNKNYGYWFAPSLGLMISLLHLPAISTPCRHRRT